MKPFRHLLPKTCLLLLAASLWSSCSTSRSDGDETESVDFETRIRPILEGQCLSCHDGSKVNNRQVNLETLEAANSSWRGGPVIVPNRPERSMLYQILATETSGARGAQPHRVSHEARQLLYTWIGEGADWPAESGPLEAR